MRTLQPNEPFVSLAVSGDVVSPHFVTQHCVWQSYQWHIDGSLVGTAFLQTTNDPDDPASWTAVTGSSQAMDAGVNPYHTTENYDACSPYYRAYFTYTSGTGDLSLVMFAKGTT